MNKQTLTTGLRRQALRWLPALALAALAGGAHAQAWPNRPIRLVVPVSPGGATDILARLVGQTLAQNLGQGVAVDSKPGAAGSIGALEVARSPADGYTFLVATSSTHSVAPAINPQLKYHPVDDFTPIALLAEANNVLLVSPTVGAKTMPELLAIAKQKPGFLNYSSSGIGSFAHLSFEYLGHQAGVQLTHVPYKGTASSITDLVSGSVHLALDAVPSALPHVKEGRLRGVAVSGARRSTLAPEIPTVAEGGVPGFAVTSWFGLYGPKNLPPEIAKRMNEEVNKVLRSPEVVAKFAAMGIEATPMTPAAFADLVAKDTVRWRNVVRDAKIKLD